MGNLGLVYVGLVIGILIGGIVGGFLSFYSNKVELQNGFVFKISGSYKEADNDECFNITGIDYCRYYFVNTNEAYYVMKFNPVESLNFLTNLRSD